MKIPYIVSPKKLKPAIAILLLILSTHALPSRKQAINLSMTTSPPSFICLNKPKKPSESELESMNTYIEAVERYEKMLDNNSRPIIRDTFPLIEKLRSLHELPEAQLEADLIAIEELHDTRHEPLSVIIPADSLYLFSALANACELGITRALMVRGALRYIAFADQQTNSELRELAIKDFKHAFENLLIGHLSARENYSDDMLKKMKVYDLIKDRAYQNTLNELNLTRNISDSPEFLIRLLASNLESMIKSMIKRNQPPTPEELLAILNAEDLFIIKPSISVVKQGNWVRLSMFLELLHKKAEDTHSSLTSYDLNLAIALVTMMQQEITDEVDLLTDFLPDNTSKTSVVMPFHTHLQTLRRITLAVDNSVASDSDQSAIERKTLLTPFLQGDLFVASLTNALKETTSIEIPDEVTNKIHYTLSKNTALPVEKCLCVSGNKKHVSQEESNTKALQYVDWYTQEKCSLKEKATSHLIEEIKKNLSDSLNKFKTSTSSKNEPHIPK